MALIQVSEIWKFTQKIGELHDSLSSLTKHWKSRRVGYEFMNAPGISDQRFEQGPLPREELWTET